MSQYYVYLTTNESMSTIYTGVTNNLERRMHEHRQGVAQGFTRRYRVKRLVYYEVTTDISSAIGREKEIKGWVRSKKAALIQSMNPAWRDLGEELFGSQSPDPSLRSG